MDDEADESAFAEDALEYAPAVIAGRFRWTIPLILGVQVVEEMGQAVVDGLCGLKMALVGHQHYTAERDEFVAEAGRDIETLVSSYDDIS